MSSSSLRSIPKGDVKLPVIEDDTEIEPTDKYDGPNVNERSRSTSLYKEIIDNGVPSLKRRNNGVSRNLMDCSNHRVYRPIDLEVAYEESKIASQKRRYLSSEDPKKKYSMKGRSLGQGSVGEVFFATDFLNRKVAIKRLVVVRKGKNREPLILREIEIIASSQHPNIVAYIEAFEMKQIGEIWIVMEYMSAGSLFDIVKIYDTVKMPESHIAFCIHEVLEALAFLHQRSRIHRDVKVDNILLHSDGAVKLADFGTAVQLTFDRLRRNTLAGTPYYMAPELIKKADYKEKVDIWSVGITVYELVTGVPPYYNLEPHEALTFISHNGVEGIPTKKNSDDIINFTNKCCLVKVPDERKSAKELLEHPFIETRCPQRDFARWLESINFLYGRNMDDDSDQWACTLL
uniref:Protein kinase domain-containing protein n=1 Tax=Arcella intermedia TaxID=1963864 RepID=A0A6B2L597_9EUKA